MDKRKTCTEIFLKLNPTPPPNIYFFLSDHKSYWDLTIQDLFLSVALLIQGFPGGSAAKNPPAVQETQFPSLGWEDPLEKKTATHTSNLAWETSLTEEPRGLQPMGS